MVQVSGIPPLARGSIDRDAPIRKDAEALDRAWADASTRVLVVRGNEIPLRSGRLAFGLVSGARGAEHRYLGKFDGASVFSVGVPRGVDPHSVHALTGVDWIPARTVGAILSADEAELVAMAAALQHWHDSSEFSPRDGSRTEAAHAGWARIEPESGVEHFPRTDPAVIVLVVHEDRALLGSNVLWETGRFSLLAGFIEAGESAEQAARREIMEESGLRIAGLDYLGSQPWPFPRSLMFGYFAALADGQDPAALSPDPEEIAELRWFTRDELRHPADGVLLPGTGSIARWVIDAWIAQVPEAEDAVGSTPETGGLGGV